VREESCHPGHCTPTLISTMSSLSLKAICSQDTHLVVRTHPPCVLPAPMEQPQRNGVPVRRADEVRQDEGDQLFWGRMWHVRPRSRERPRNVRASAIFSPMPASSMISAVRERWLARGVVVHRETITIDRRRKDRQMGYYQQWFWWLSSIAMRSRSYENLSRCLVSSNRHLMCATGSMTSA
jgi:hypothetical protein